MTSDLEEQFLACWRLMCRANRIDPVDPEREYQFAAPRRWRFDFAWPNQQVAIEMEGGTWTGGRHNTGAGMKNDMEKYNAAVATGWLVLRFTAAHLKQDPQGVFEQIVDCLNTYRSHPGRMWQMGGCE